MTGLQCIKYKTPSYEEFQCLKPTFCGKKYTQEENGIDANFVCGEAEPDPERLGDPRVVGVECSTKGAYCSDKLCCGSAVNGDEKKSICNTAVATFWKDDAGASWEFSCLQDGAKALVASLFALATASTLLMA